MTATTNTQQPQFSTGQVVVTPSVRCDIADNSTFATLVMESLRRHVCGDWGDVPDEKNLSVVSIYEQAMIN